ncbi:Oxygen oxidoreductase covalent FAD-binding site [Colletotrichum karsti]|uniref:Oxygen oxidoreductase covalent FAD-binding site n=1 Tax=Colletotrichum karsti TaxID=1095194 RepID=A0A9P6I606_9PEZI|nr:Oxygen oxidoreductase covalent FAD-binding site [Colletotrichum karsti]KAF9876382.1 Oxygen oxidoreductase covalent FAD-binding site [Colletotrichum karsti]
MDSINIAADKKTVHVGGGVIAGSLQQALEARGLFTPTGQVKTVGYVSWACGGGYGFYVGTYGFGVDQIVGARVVIVDGNIIDTDDDKELLWALRGAGAGTFGVIVELPIKVYPTPKIYAGFLGFALTEAGAVFSKFQALVSDKFLTSSAVMP